MWCAGAAHPSRAPRERHVPANIPHENVPRRGVPFRAAHPSAGRADSCSADGLCRYYAQRASAGLIISEATVVSEQGIGWVETPGLYTDEMREGWRKVTSAVHTAGGKIVAQLWHQGARACAVWEGRGRDAHRAGRSAGRASHSTFHGGALPVAPSAISIGEEVHGADGQKYPHEVPRALETAEIPGVVATYRAAAQVAKDAGFDGAPCSLPRAAPLDVT